MSIENYIAEHRFGFGPKAGSSVSSGDPRDWLLDQLSKSASAPQLSGLSNTTPLMGQLAGAKKQRKQEAAQNGGKRNDKQVKSLRKEIRGNYIEEVQARFDLFANTETPFLERLVWFWTNYFTVSGSKHKIMPMLGAYEREAIRPNVTGYFKDMLFSAEKHPAMVVYLDNQASVNPGMGERRRLRREAMGMPVKGKKGINENLAREIMELHTLGVDGGYTQTDVTNFAHVLTGWSIDKGNGGFGFQSNFHDGQSQEILGKTYSEAGIKQGEAVLNDLASHPSTAHYIAKKLAKHFISDNPPENLVKKLASAFTKSNGHLPTVYKELVNSDEAWDKSFNKAKNHIEYMASAFRLLPKVKMDPAKLIGSLDQFGQKPWFAPSPQGWSDDGSTWLTPDSLWKRIEWSGVIADRIGNNIDARELAEAAYGPLLSDNTKQSIARAESGSQALALLLLSPEFQRR